jgi:hypothetical protein
MKKGKVLREDCYYKRKGVCSILVAVEPLTGKRLIEVSDRRTKRDYADFMKMLSKEYSKCKKIILVQDNLNTHTSGSFYENFPSEEAFELSQSFDMHYTPKHASWLNMAEIEISALSKQCIGRRLGNIDLLRNEIDAWVKVRNERRIKIEWKFTKTIARKKLSKMYDCIQN